MKEFAMKSFIFFSVLIACSSLTIFTPATGSPLTNKSLKEDILNVEMQGVRIDVSEMVQKHIPVGMSKESAFNVLKSEGFEKIYKNEELLRNSKEKIQADEVFSVSWKYKKTMISHYEASIFLFFDQAKVSGVYGKIVYRVL